MLLRNRRGGVPGAVEEAEGRDLGRTHPCTLTGPKALCSRPSAPAPSGYPVIPPPSSPLMGAGEWGLWLWPLAGESGACTLEKGFHLASTFSVAQPTHI